jgi:ribosomal protein S18 acetylase RimI-like enzyme
VYLRPLERADVPALLAIHAAAVGPDAAWSAAVLEGQLWNPGHGDGANAAVVTDANHTVIGVAGWVDPGDGTFYGAPVLARDRAAANLLVAMLIVHAHKAGAVRLRIGCAAGEPHKRDALVARGFAVALEFVTMACAPSPRESAPPAGLVHAPLASVAPEVLREVHDASMLAIDNSAPMSLDDARHQQARAWAPGSGVWLDGDRPAAFLILIRDREPVDHVLIDQIGVAPAWRRRGVARALVDRAIDHAARDGAVEVRGLIASTNRPSLALHEAAGLREAWRREMFELVLGR